LIFSLRVIFDRDAARSTSRHVGFALLATGFARRRKISQRVTNGNYSRLCWFAYGQRCSMGTVFSIHPYTNSTLDYIVYYNKHKDLTAV